MNTSVIAGAILMSATINARDGQYEKRIGTGQLYNHLESNFQLYAENYKEYNELDTQNKAEVKECYLAMIVTSANSQGGR